MNGLADPARAAWSFFHPAKRGTGMGRQFVTIGGRQASVSGSACRISPVTMRGPSGVM